MNYFGSIIDCSVWNTPINYLQAAATNYLQAATTFCVQGELPEPVNAPYKLGRSHYLTWPLVV